MSEFSTEPAREDAMTVDELESLQTDFARGADLTQRQVSILGVYPEFVTPRFDADPDFEGDINHPTERNK